MPDLTTRYLGLDLASPIVASGSKPSRASFPSTRTSGRRRRRSGSAPGEWSGWVWVTTIQRMRSPAAATMASRCPSSSGPGSMTATSSVPTR